METNKNKIIFYIIGGFVIFLILVFFLVLNNFNSNNKVESKDEVADLTIWTNFDYNINLNKLASEFKEEFPNYSNKQIKFLNFPSYDEYSLALSYAITKNEGPDIFMINNNDSSIFEHQDLWLDNSVININEFRKKFKTIFSNDLIKKGEDGDKEYLLGIPVGYETLGIFYNKKYITSSDLESFSTLNKKILEIRKGNTSVVPIGIGNGKNVEYVEDIISQFFLFSENGGDSLEKLTSNQIRKQIKLYINFGIEQTLGNNFDVLENNSLDLFLKNKIYMIVGYPKFINNINKSGGFSSSFLFVEPLPHPQKGVGKTFVNYDYFALNKSSKNIGVAKDFLRFLASEEGQEDFLENYPFYLPALLSLQTELDTKKISKKYNIVIGDFYNSDYELSSFNKGIKMFYDKNIKNILDLGNDFYIPFLAFQRSLVCKTNKIFSLTNVEVSCE